MTVPMYGSAARQQVAHVTIAPIISAANSKTNPNKQNKRKEPA